jgi:hypothetical protein
MCGVNFPILKSPKVERVHVPVPHGQGVVEHREPQPESGNFWSQVEIRLQKGGGVETNPSSIHIFPTDICI